MSGVTKYLLLLLLIPHFHLLAEDKGEIKKYEQQLQDTTLRLSEKDRDHRETTYDADLYDLDFYWAALKGFVYVFFASEGEIEDLYAGNWPGYNNYPYFASELDEASIARARSTGYRVGRTYRSGLYNDARLGLTGDGDYISIITGYYRHNSDLDGYHLAFRGGFATLFEISAETSGLREQIPDGTDHLQLSNVFIEYNRWRFSSFVLRWGLGWKGITGDDQYYSFAPSLGVEFFPIYPVSLYYHFNGCKINQAWVSEHQARLNIHYNQYFASVGYQQFKADAAGLPGLLFGVGTYF